MANPARTIQQSTISRYRNTRVFSDSSGKVFYGTWRSPKIRQTKLPYIHIVAIEELKRPDLISYRVYQDPSMFWAIAVRNNIFMPMRDLTPGMTLMCPHVDDISAALSESSSSSSGE